MYQTSQTVAVNRSRIADIITHPETSFLKHKQGEKIMLPMLNELRIFKSDEISHFKSFDYLSYVHLGDGSHQACVLTLKNLEERYLDGRFYRIHKSHIINLECVERIIKKDRWKVVLKGGYTLDVARARKDAFIRYIEFYFNAI